MEPSGEIKNLLVELRDVQREHLAEYRKVTEQSLELQRQAVVRQEQLGRLYQRVVLTAAVLAAGVIVFLIYLVGRYR